MLLGVDKVLEKNNFDFADELTPMPSASHREPNTDCREPSTDCQEPSTDCQEPSTDCLEPTTDGQEPNSEQRFSSQEASSETTEDKSSSSVGLLRALLSPVERRSPHLYRTQSEDCPVPPPRKNRDKSKSSRRHTVGTLSARLPQIVSEEGLQQSVVKTSSSEPKACDNAKEKSTERWSEDIETNNDAPPLPPRIASNMKLMREDSDFVDIEMGDVLVIDDEAAADREIAKENVIESLATISDEEEYKERRIDEKPSNREEMNQKNKTEPNKTRFSRIKSLLSGKVEN